MPVIGVDVGGTSVKMAAVENGKVFWTGKSQTYTRPGIELLSHTTREAVGAGLCVPGLLDKVKRIITLSVNVPGLNGTSLDGLVETSLGQGVGKVQLVNDDVGGAPDIW